MTGTRLAAVTGAFLALGGALVAVPLLAFGALGLNSVAVERDSEQVVEVASTPILTLDAGGSRVAVGVGPAGRMSFSDRASVRELTRQAGRAALESTQLRVTASAEEVRASAASGQDPPHRL